MFPQRLRALRKEKGLTQQNMAEFLGLTRQGYAKYENNQSEPDNETLQKLADYFDVSIDYLLGRTDKSENTKPYYALTEKDERDIAKDLEKMMGDLESKEAMAFHGEPMDEETKELLRISLENSMRIAKEMAKKKFTPKKHRK